MPDTRTDPRIRAARRRAWAARAGWLAVAAPALAQLALLVWAFAGRYGFPYDLEWMEGGMLVHAERLAHGQTIYPPPSIEFIPYLYTPLYPALIAALGTIFGISYQLARAISIGATLAIVIVMVREVARGAAGGEQRDGRGAAWCGAALAAGLFAATYPWLEGWYDIARADTLFVAMITGGLSVLRTQARRGNGLAGHARVAAVAAVLGASFLCKQTGVLYVALGGAALLVWNWRRVPVYVAVTGAIGLGGTALANRATGGWFWTYVYEVHQVHEFSMERFWLSFEHMLGKFPAMTWVIATTLAVVAVTAAVAPRGGPGGDPNAIPDDARRVSVRLPDGAGVFLLWTAAFAVSIVVGALGWGTQWAHFNAYMPAMTTGAIAAGAAIVALRGAARAWARREAAGAQTAPGATRPASVHDDGPPGGRSNAAPVREWAVSAGAAVAAVALALELVGAWWSPRALIPTPRDRLAGAALIAKLRAIEGEVWIPYHPWYARMAGKPRTYVHRMGVMDVSYKRAFEVAGLADALREGAFAAVVLDQAQPGWELSRLRGSYRLEEYLPREAAPVTVTGARTRPRSVWVPRRESLPAGARALFDFEDGRLTGWDIDGAAWGRAPRSRPLPGQSGVPGHRGRYFVSSYHGRDRARGVLTSPPFAIAGTHITFRLSGGADRARLRVELRVDGEVVRTAANPRPSPQMHVETWDVSALAGKTARLVLIDEATGGWGHLNADHFLLWTSPPPPGRDD